MGVTNRSKIQTCKASVASSTVASSSESLHLPSESGSYQYRRQQQQQPEHGDSSFRRALGLLTHAQCSTARPASLGRRRANRVKCLFDLESLARIDEEHEADTVATYTANRHSPFLKIISDDRLSKVWEHFCSRSETEQSNMLSESGRRSSRHGNKAIGTKHDSRGSGHGDRDCRNGRRAIDAYKSLAYLTRRRLRKVKNLQPLCIMEQVILDHFYSSRRKMLENVKLDKQSQFICCAACQYYNLEMITRQSEQGVVTCTIADLDDCYTHCAVMLSSFLRVRRGSS